MAQPPPLGMPATPRRRAEMRRAVTTIAHALHALRRDPPRYTKDAGLTQHMNTASSVTSADAHAHVSGAQQAAETVHADPAWQTGDPAGQHNDTATQYTASAPHHAAAQDSYTTTNTADVDVVSAAAWSSPVRATAASERASPSAPYSHSPQMAAAASHAAAASGSSSDVWMSSALLGVLLLRSEGHSVRGRMSDGLAFLMQRAVPAAVDVCFCVSIARLRIEDAFDDTHVAGCNTADVVECVVFPAAPDVVCILANLPAGATLMAVRLPSAAAAQSAQLAVRAATQQASWAHRQRARLESRISRQQTRSGPGLGLGLALGLASQGSPKRNHPAPPLCPSTPERSAATAASAAMAPPSPSRLDPVFIDDASGGRKESHKRELAVLLDQALMDLLFSTLAERSLAVITSAKAFSDACTRVAQMAVTPSGANRIANMRRRLLDTVQCLPQAENEPRERLALMDNIARQAKSLAQVVRDTLQAAATLPTSMDASSPGSKIAWAATSRSTSHLSPSGAAPPAARPLFMGSAAFPLSPAARFNTADDNTADTAHCNAISNDIRNAGYNAGYNAVGNAVGNAGYSAECNGAKSPPPSQMLRRCVLPSSMSLQLDVLIPAVATEAHARASSRAVAKDDDALERIVRKTITSFMRQLVLRQFDDGPRSALDAFMLAYRLTASPSALLDAILAHMRQEPTHHTACLEVARVWIILCWPDIAATPELPQRLQEQLGVAYDRTPDNTILAEVLCTLKAQMAVGVEQPTPHPQRTRFGPTPGILQQISSENLAEQLTLLDCDLFLKVHPLEYLSYSFKLVPLAPNVPACNAANLKAVIQRFKEEQAWVEKEICLPDTRKRQMALFVKFLRAAKHCLDLGNFFSFFAILAALDAPEVADIVRAGRGLPDKLRRMLAELQAVTDPSRNMKSYRDLYNQRRLQPRLPFLPLHLKDLYFANASFSPASASLQDALLITRLVLADVIVWQPYRMRADFGMQAYFRVSVPLLPALRQTATASSPSARTSTTGARGASTDAGTATATATNTGAAGQAAAQTADATARHALHSPSASATRPLPSAVAAADVVGSKEAVLSTLPATPPKAAAVLARGEHLRAFALSSLTSPVVKNGLRRRVSNLTMSNVRSALRGGGSTTARRRIEPLGEGFATPSAHCTHATKGNMSLSPAAGGGVSPRARRQVMSLHVSADDRISPTLPKLYLSADAAMREMEEEEDDCSAGAVCMPRLSSDEDGWATEDDDSDLCFSSLQATCMLPTSPEDNHDGSHTDRENEKATDNATETEIESDMPPVRKSLPLAQASASTSTGCATEPSPLHQHHDTLHGTCQAQCLSTTSAPVQDAVATAVADTFGDKEEGLEAASTLHGAAQQLSTPSAEVQDAVVAVADDFGDEDEDYLCESKTPQDNGVMLSQDNGVMLSQDNGLPLPPPTMPRDEIAIGHTVSVDDNALETYV